ncbi:hypothetical protein ON064_04600 [Planococcus sp. A6]|uniref:hypothetical protein n=1 Tax=Planococcus TaxID=1372 RepID=UPI001B8BE14C|nr:MULTISPECIES: hypothetical protein [unclassified Planococcus (in: firmicutes)]MDE0582324.1 hypothetical protein [Planococcus sp. A6]
MMKKLLSLFFVEDTDKQDGGKDGYFMVFAAWGLILLANGISEYFIGNALIDNWFVILMIGLVVFFASEVFSKETSEEGD